jgi:hypothetical protein
VKFIRGENAIGIAAVWEDVRPNNRYERRLRYKRYNQLG